MPFLTFMIILETKKVMYCTNCGYKLEVENKFCSNCGNKKSTLTSDFSESNKKEQLLEEKELSLVEKIEQEIRKIKNTTFGTTFSTLTKLLMFKSSNEAGDTINQYASKYKIDLILEVKSLSSLYSTQRSLLQGFIDLKIVSDKEPFDVLNIEGLEEYHKRKKSLKSQTKSKKRKIFYGIGWVIAFVIIFKMCTNDNSKVESNYTPLGKNELQSYFELQAGPVQKISNNDKIIDTYFFTSKHVFDLGNNEITRFDYLQNKTETTHFKVIDIFKDSGSLSNSYVFSINHPLVKEIWFNLDLEVISYEYKDEYRQEYKLK